MKRLLFTLIILCVIVILPSCTNDEFSEVVIETEKSEVKPIDEVPEEDVTPFDD